MVFHQFNNYPFGSDPRWLADLPLDANLSNFERT
jgi:hypothetical protein